MRTILPFILYLSLQFNALSQIEKRINKDYQFWTSSFQQIRITNKFGLYMDASYRRSSNFLEQPFQLVIRPGVIYYLSNKVRIIGGYAYFSHYPGRTSRHIVQPEHRGWQQLQWNQKYDRLSTRQFIRFEQRFRRKFLNNDELSDEYNFNYRLRYNFSISIPLKGSEGEPKSVFASITDEIMVNFGKEIIYNYFDQNRASVMLGYQLSKSSNILVGYMHIFQQTASGNAFNSNSAIRITFNQNLDLRSQEQ